MKTYVGDEMVTFKGPALKVAATDTGAHVLGTFRNKGDAAPVNWPGVISRSYGKGRVVYLACGFDAAYYLYSYPYQRLALKHAIEWAAAGPKPMVVTAPMCVHATLMRQTTKDGQRLVVHLFSDLNTTGQHAFAADDVPLREEVVPIHDIQVSFAPTYRFRRIHLEPGGVDLPIEQTPTGSSVTVPRLGVHTMVVGELE